MRNIYDFYITPDEYERAKSNGISGKTLDYRIREALWDKEEAITSTIQVNKVYPKEIKEIAEENGVSMSTLKSRVNLMGWDMLRAAITPVMDKRQNIYKAIPKVRKYPKEIIEKARLNGIPDKCFYNRITKYKWSIEKACTTPVMTPHEMGLANKERGQIGLDLIFAHNMRKKKSL